MLGAAKAAFRSCLLRTSRTTPTRIYHSSIPSYRPYIRRSALWYRRNGTPRSKLIGTLNVSFIFIYAFASNAGSHSQMTEIALVHLFRHEIDHRDYDFSTIKDLVNFFLKHIAAEKGEIREYIMDMLETSQSSRDSFRKYLGEYREICRNWKEDPVKTGFALLQKGKETISDVELRINELPVVEVERPFRESPAGTDRYENSSDGKVYEEVG